MHGWLQLLILVDEEEDDSIFTKESSTHTVLSKVCSGVKNNQISHDGGKLGKVILFILHASVTY